MAEPKIRYLGDLQRLTLNQDDIMVLMVDDHITSETALRLREVIVGSVPDGVRVIVLGKGMKFGIIGREASHPDGNGAAAGN